MTKWMRDKYKRRKNIIFQINQVKPNRTPEALIFLVRLPKFFKKELVTF